jgi:hypothetical protein
MRTLLFVLLLAASSAFADVIGPDQEACQRRRAGEACRIDGRSGTCADSTCSRIDYSGGQGPRGTVQFPCLVCKADGPPKREAPVSRADVIPPVVPTDTGTTTAAAAAGVLAAGLLFAYLWHRRSNGRNSRA